MHESYFTLKVSGAITLKQSVGRGHHYAIVEFRADPISDMLELVL